MTVNVKETFITIFSSRKKVLLSWRNSDDLAYTHFEKKIACKKKMKLSLARFNSIGYYKRGRMVKLKYHNVRMFEHVFYLLEKKVTIPFLSSSFLSLIFRAMHVCFTRLFCIQIII